MSSFKYYIENFQAITVPRFNWHETRVQLRPTTVEIGWIAENHVNCCSQTECTAGQLFRFASVGAVRLRSDAVWGYCRTCLVLHFFTCKKGHKDNIYLPRRHT